MSRGLSLLVSACLSALALLVTGSLLLADPPAQDASSGYKTVMVDVGGQKVPIRVKQQFDPIKNPGALADPLDHQRAFSETNAMANKSFMSGNVTGWNKASDLKLIDAYATKPYFNNVAGANGYGSKAVFRNTAFETHTATSLDKSFPTSAVNLGHDQTAAFAPIGSDLQNRTAPINGKSIEKFPSTLGQKKFVVTEPSDVKHKMGELGNGTPLSSLPDRPLSIDEVRNLINHGFKPDTSQPASAPSKALNDPNYQPEPLREDPDGADSSAPAPRNASDIDDDKDDAIPPPGTMAAPENSEPLPKK